MFNTLILVCCAATQVGYLPSEWSIDREVRLELPGGTLFGSSDFLNFIPVQTNSGKIAVLDEGYDKILLFNKVSGKFIKRFVKNGHGPDELGLLSNFCISEKYIVVIDGSNSRSYNLYTSEGVFLKKIRIQASGILETRVLPIIFLEKYLVMPSTFTSSMMGEHRIAIRDLFSGELFDEVSPRAPFLKMVQGFQAVAMDGHSFWAPVANTRRFQQFDARFQLINELNLGLGTEEEFEPKEYNRLASKNNPKHFSDVFEYYHGKCQIPQRFFVSKDYIITYDFSGISGKNTFSIFPKNGEDPHRVLFDESRIDGPGLPMGMDGDRLYFFKESDDDRYAGSVVFVRLGKGKRK